jgi:hypothetical protein
VDHSVVQRREASRISGVHVTAMLQQSHHRIVQAVLCTVGEQRIRFQSHLVDVKAGLSTTREQAYEQRDTGSPRAECVSYSGSDKGTQAETVAESRDRNSGRDRDTRRRERT